MRKSLWLISALVLTWLCACSSQKDPAEKAFAQLQASINPVSGDMERYAPKEYAQLLDVVNDMKAKLNAHDYAAVLALQPKAMSQLLVTSGATATRRIEVQRAAAAEWKALLIALPKRLAELTERVADLRAGKKLPAGVTADAVTQVAEQLGGLKSAWAMALSSARQGALDTAVTKAKELQQQCAQLGAQIGLKLNE